MKGKGMGIAQIARILDRSKGAVSMEIIGNKEDDKYMPCVAQKKYEKKQEHKKNNYSKQNFNS